MDDGAFLLTGEKAHVTNGGVADLFTVFARVDGDASGRDGITAFLVPSGPGVERGAEQETLGVRAASHTSLRLVDLRVERGQVLGEQGAGFKAAMELLNISRLAGAAGCAGLCRGALAETLRHALERRAFGRPIAQLGMIQAKLGHMAVDSFVLDSLIHLIADLIDQGRTDTSMECAVAKVFASETAWRVVNESLQIAGARGYLKAGPFERLLRDARANLVLNGTNEVLRRHIAMAGLAGPAELLRGVSEATRRPLRSIGLLADYALAVFNRRWKRHEVSLAHPAVRKLLDPLLELVARMGDVTERMLREHGPEILHQEFVQARLADVTVDLYASFAALSHTSRLLTEGDQERAREALSCSTIFVNAARRRVVGALRRCESNEDELLRDIALAATRRLS